MFDVGIEEKKKTKSEGIMLPDDTVIKSLKEGEGCKIWVCCK